jgi:predicted transcriptional regulator
MRYVKVTARCELDLRAQRRHSERNRRVTKERKPSRRVPAAPRLQDTVRLSAEGLGKVLGDLESRVLRAVWALGKPVPARVVHETIEPCHPVSSLTVITVLNKLVKKGVLARGKHDDLFHYWARLSEPEFMAHASRRVVEGILSLGPDAVAASFVDVLAEQDPGKLAELGRLIRRKLRESDR